ncbi:MAG: winged helix-turn-helix domain-containing protein [Candidatus Omnitrophica bacterium]|nr:winged helix-turn-helix domain-containing protein [Candidatus Omnitrophota bacterium]
MIEKLVTSRMRAKLLRLFLTNIDNRFYLRELERLLNESLSPLRRQLIKLVKMGILITEHEGNLKYYRLNKSFERIEDLRRLVLGNEGAPYIGPKANDTVPKGNDTVTFTKTLSQAPPLTPTLPPKVERMDEGANVARRMKYDVVILTGISLVVLIVAIFTIYSSNKNIRQIADLVAEKTIERTEVVAKRIGSPTRPDEMVSRRWKLLPGNVPVLSSGDTGGGNRSSEL